MTLKLEEMLDAILATLGGILEQSLKTSDLLREAATPSGAEWVDHKGDSRLKR